MHFCRVAWRLMGVPRETTGVRRTTHACLDFAGHPRYTSWFLRAKGKVEHKFSGDLSSLKMLGRAKGLEGGGC